MKKQNRFKLTPEVYKSLKEISKNLGAFQRRDKNGKLMFRKSTQFIGYEKGEKEGSIVKKTNHGQEPIMVNHDVNLTEIYQKDGQSGVDVYVKFFEDLTAEEKLKTA